jgi:hypothetical protein
MSEGGSKEDNQSRPPMSEGGELYGGHDLVDRYGISVSQMTTNIFHLS